MTPIFPDCRENVRLALIEDIGTGDVTTQFTIAPEAAGIARMVAKQSGVIAGLPIVGFEDREDGRIDIVCSAELIPVSPTPRRAHQGWRYLEEADAPTNESDGTGLAELPPRLYGKLAALALV